MAAPGPESTTRHGCLSFSNSGRLTRQIIHRNVNRRTFGVGTLGLEVETGTGDRAVAGCFLGREAANITRTRTGTSSATRRIRPASASRRSVATRRSVCILHMDPVDPPADHPETAERPHLGSRSPPWSSRQQGVRQIGARLPRIGVLRVASSQLPGLQPLITKAVCRPRDPQVARRRAPPRISTCGCGNRAISIGP